MLDGKRALLLAISHELRSPLTRARLNAELLPENPDGEVARAALLRDLAEMRDLISDLLESERLSDAHAALNREPVDLSALIEALVEGRSAWNGLQVRLPQDLPVVAADAMRLRLAIRNLIDNAIRHGAGGALPVLSASTDGKNLRLSLIHISEPTRPY